MDRKRTERRIHFLHTLSKHIVSECVKRSVGTIVIGDLGGIRDDENGEPRNWGKHGNFDLHGWAFDRFTSIPELCDVTRVGSEVVDSVFMPYGQSEHDPYESKHIERVESAIESEACTVFRAVYRTYIPPVWVGDHFLQANKESRDRQRLKLVAAEFLDRRGHEMPTTENPYADGTCKHNRECLYSGDCFECHYPLGIADVACHCSDHTTYVEVGYAAAEKWSRSFDEGRADTLLIVPYGHGETYGRRGGDTHIYFFHRSDEGCV